jgi:Protein of unknown function (DUF2796)
LTVPPDRARTDRSPVIQVIAMKTPSLLFASAACCAVALCVLLTRPTLAEEFEQHPPHEHGKVTINAALDGNQLVIELDSPAVNVVGFEHEPRNDDERAAVSAAGKLLRDGRGLFAMPKEARCQFEKAEIKAPRWETTDDVPGQPEAPGQHADYEARFTYHCWSPGHLSWLEPALLDKLRNVTEARLNIATPRGQQSEVATSGHARVAIQ